MTRRVVAGVLGALLLAGCSTATTSEPWPDAPEPVSFEETWHGMSASERDLLCAEYAEQGWEQTKAHVGGEFVEALSEACEVAS